jgi:RNA polymerase sigma-70 factor (ECF subfamily)
MDGFEEMPAHPEALVSMQSEEILQLVRKLPPATQAVFNLYVVDGYTHKEIAGMLQISEGTSKWHLSEARKTLQKQLKEYM